MPTFAELYGHNSQPPKGGGRRFTDLWGGGSLSLGTTDIGPTELGTHLPGPQDMPPPQPESFWQWTGNKFMSLLDWINGFSRVGTQTIAGVHDAMDTGEWDVQAGWYKYSDQSDPHKALQSGLGILTNAGQGAFIGMGIAAMPTLGIGAIPGAIIGGIIGAGIGLAEYFGLDAIPDTPEQSADALREYAKRKQLEAPDSFGARAAAVLPWFAGLWNEQTMAEMSFDPLIAIGDFGPILRQTSMGIKMAESIERATSPVKGAFLSLPVVAPLAEFANKQLFGIAGRQMRKIANETSRVSMAQMEALNKDIANGAKAFADVVGVDKYQEAVSSMANIIEKVPKEFQIPEEDALAVILNRDKALGPTKLPPWVADKMPPSPLGDPFLAAERGVGPTDETNLLYEYLLEEAQKTFGDQSPEVHEMAAKFMQKSITTSALEQAYATHKGIPVSALNDMQYLFHLVTKDFKAARMTAVGAKSIDAYTDFIKAERSIRNTLGKSIAQEMKGRNIREPLNAINQWAANGRKAVEEGHTVAQDTISGFVNGSSDLQTIARGVEIPEGFIPIAGNIFHTDPYALLYARSARTVQAVNAVDFMKAAAKQFGKHISELDPAVHAGWKTLKQSMSGSEWDNTFGLLEEAVKRNKREMAGLPPDPNDFLPIDPSDFANAKSQAPSAPVGGVKIETGKPVVLQGYHATTAKFNEFKVGMPRTKESDLTARGVFFYGDKFDAERLSLGEGIGRTDPRRIILEKDVKLNNPYVFKNYKELYDYTGVDYRSPNKASELTQALRSKGHDGFVKLYQTKPGIDEFAVFDTSQIHNPIPKPTAPVGGSVVDNAANARPTVYEYAGKEPSLSSGANVPSDYSLDDNGMKVLNKVLGMTDEARSYMKEMMRRSQITPQFKTEAFLRQKEIQTEWHIKKLNELSNLLDRGELMVHPAVRQKVIKLLQGHNTLGGLSASETYRKVIDTMLNVSSEEWLKLDRSTRNRLTDLFSGEPIYTLRDMAGKRDYGFEHGMVIDDAGNKVDITVRPYSEGEIRFPITHNTTQIHTHPRERRYTGGMSEADVGHVFSDGTELKRGKGNIHIAHEPGSVFFLRYGSRGRNIDPNAAMGYGAAFIKDFDTNLRIIKQKKRFDVDKVGVEAFNYTVREWNKFHPDLILEGGAVEFGEFNTHAAKTLEQIEPSVTSSILGGSSVRHKSDEFMELGKKLSATEDILDTAKNIAFPDKQTADAVLRHFNAMRNVAKQPVAIMRHMARYKRLWGAITLTPWTSSGMRNLIGGAFINEQRFGGKAYLYNIEAAFDLANHTDVIDQFAREGLYSSNQMKELMGKVDHFVEETPLSGTVMQSGFKRFLKKVSPWEIGEAGLDANEKFYGNSAYQMIDNHQRTVAAKAFMAEGQTVQEAVKSAMHLHFDYGDVPEWYNQIRPALSFPTWALKMVPLQFELLLRNPAYYARRARVALASQQATGMLPSETPEMIQQGGGFGIPTMDKENPMYFRPENFDPIAIWSDISEPFKFAYDMFNPFITEPIEQMTGVRKTSSGFGGPTEWIPTLPKVGAMVGNENTENLGYDPFMQRPIVRNYTKFNSAIPILGGKDMPAWLQRGDHVARGFVRSYTEWSSFFKTQVDPTKSSTQSMTENAARRGLGVPLFWQDMDQSIYFNLRHIDQRIGAEEGRQWQDPAVLKDLYLQKLALLAHGTFAQQDPFTGAMRHWKDYGTSEDDFTIKGRRTMWQASIETCWLLLHGATGPMTEPRLRKPIKLDESESEYIQGLLNRIYDTYTVELGNAASRGEAQLKRGMGYVQDRAEVPQ